jgi:hypothetical protein
MNSTLTMNKKLLKKPLKFAPINLKNPEYSYMEKKLSDSTQQ